METHKGDIPSKYGDSAPKLVNRQTFANDTVINVNGIEIGGKEIVIIAGPCAVENKEQILETAKAVFSGGANILRGGAFKPRTSPYSFQGLWEEGLMAEVHNKPLDALSDGQQSLYPNDFVRLVKDIKKIAQACGRKIYHHKPLIA